MKLKVVVVYPLSSAATKDLFQMFFLGFGRRLSFFFKRKGALFLFRESYFHENGAIN